MDRPWEKNLVGGSDDHSSLYIAKSFTEVEGAVRLDDFWEGIKQGRSEPFCTAPCDSLDRRPRHLRRGLPLLPGEAEAQEPP